MGCCFSVNCSKCGVPAKYYRNGSTKSCREHDYEDNGNCQRCDGNGNCFHSFNTYPPLLS